MSTADRETAFAGPTALATLGHERQAHPRELVEVFLNRIESIDPQLNASRAVLGEQALAEADALAGERLAGPLAGVPIAIKDDLPLAGERAVTAARRRWRSTSRAASPRTRRRLA